MAQALSDWAAAPGHHGVSAAAVFADGTEWSAAAGLAGLSESLQRTHLIAIGSITKTMTAAVLLQLAAEGRLALDDPISAHLPSRLHVNPAITIRQLLNHTSGVANYTGTAALTQAVASSPGHVFTADELLDFIGPPRFAPGSGTEYTNTAFLLAGQIAERVGGANIATLYRTRLWMPNGLTGSWLPGFGSAPGPVAAALSQVGLTVPTDRMELLSVGHSAFGVMATASDVARWGHALFTGPVISGAMQTEMRRLVAAAGNIPGESGSGLGIRGYTYFGRSQLGHSGAAAFGNALLLHDTAGRAVLMNQSAGADHFVLGPTLLSIALGGT